MLSRTVVPSFFPVIPVVHVSYAASIYLFLQAASFVSEIMMITMQNHQERLDNATISLDDEGGLVLPKEHRPIVVGFIFRLVEPEVWL